MILDLKQTAVVRFLSFYKQKISINCLNFAFECSNSVNMNSLDIWHSPSRHPIFVTSEIVVLIPRRNDAISNVREAARIALEKIGGEEAKKAMHITKVLSGEIQKLSEAH